MSTFYTGCALIALASFFLDFFLALLVGAAVDATLYVPICLLWLTLGTGLISALCGVLQTAVIEREFCGMVIKRLFYRWGYSYILAAALMYNGVDSDCLFYPGFAEGEQFIPFLIMAFLVCSVIFFLHWLVTRAFCKRVAAYRARAAQKREVAYREWQKNNPGWTEPYPEPERDEELEKFSEIVDNQ